MHKEFDIVRDSLLYCMKTVVYDMSKVESLLLVYSYINHLPKRADDKHTCEQWLTLDSFILLYIYSGFSDI